MSRRYDPDPEADEILRWFAEQDAAEEAVFAQRGVSAQQRERDAIAAAKAEEKRREERFWGTLWNMYLGREVR